MLTLTQTLPVTAHNGGLFVSRGTGSHPDRTISSHELIVVRSGTLAIQEEANPFVLSSGDTLLLFPHRRHFGTRPYTSDLSFYWFHFAVEPLSPDIESLLHVPQRVAARDMSGGEEMVTLCRRFLDVQAKEDPHSGFRRSLLLLEMLSEITSRVGHGAAPRDNSGTRLADRANGLLRVRFAEADLSTQTVADTLGVNPDYLGRVFRRTFGQPLTSVLQDYRIRYARALLLEDSRNISETAAASGFADAGYFRPLFKQRFAVSPQGFRCLHAQAYVNTQ